MNSEERHQLQTNDLGVVAERTVGFFERHMGTILGAACAALLALAVGYWWTQSVETGAESGWTLLNSAQTIDDYGAVTDKFKGEPAAQWAQLIVSETNLKTALPTMFKDRAIAITDIKSAREGFESLLAEKKVDLAIRERALWGLALCVETTCDGNVENPIKAYEALTKEFPDSIFKLVAEDRIASLKKEGSKDFYAWFSKENPKPPEARPRDFKPEGAGTSDFSGTKEGSGDSLFNAPKSQKVEPAAQKDEPVKEAVDPVKEAVDEAKPVEEKVPVEKSPVEEKAPVEEKSPVEEVKPTEEAAKAESDPVKTGAEPGKKD